MGADRESNTGWSLNEDRALPSCRALEGFCFQESWAVIKPADAPPAAGAPRRRQVRIRRRQR